MRSFSNPIVDAAVTGESGTGLSCCCEGNKLLEFHFSPKSRRILRRLYPESLFGSAGGESAGTGESGSNFLIDLLRKFVFAA